MRHERRARAVPPAVGRVTPARAWPVRIVVTGPECTGKTTLAATLAESLGAPWVREASRAYAEAAAADGRELTVADVAPIARRQVAAEDAAYAAHPPLVVLDTDLMSTVVYADDYYGHSDAWLGAEALERRGELYLLCAPDIPWEPDGIRDRPTERERMYRLFASTLAAHGARVREVRGLGDARLAAARAAVDELARARADAAGAAEGAR